MDLTFQTDNTLFNVKLEQEQNAFSLNDLIILCNLHYFYKEGSLSDLYSRLYACLFDLAFLQISIIENERDTVSENELFSTNARNTLNEPSLKSLNNIAE